VPRVTLNGSWLQLREGAFLEGESDQYEDYPWPAGDHWIVGRELLIYKSVNLSLVPKLHRQQVLAQNITRFSPFQNTGRYLIEEKGSAEVWIWDEALRLEEVHRVVNRSAGLDRKLQRVKPIPEPLLFKPSLNGRVDQPMAEGVDVQTWREGRLTNSSWQLDGEFKTESNEAKPESWLDARHRNSGDVEPIIWRSGFWLLGLFLFYQVGVYSGWMNTLEEHERKYAEETIRASGLIELRNEARLERQLNDQLTIWHSQPLQISVIAEFDRLIPETAKLRSWSYDDRKLKVLVVDPELNNRTYVENLEGSQTFADVRIEPGLEVNTAMIELLVQP
jgi:hypothetical protein